MKVERKFLDKIMKTKITIIATLLAFALTGFGQFGPSAVLKYPYTNTLKASDVFPIGVVGQTNKNIASSNLFNAALAAAAAGGVTVAIDGSNLSNGTVNSNKLDAATLALLGVGSGVSSAQVSAIIKTNDGYYTARHINLEGGMRNLRGTLASNVPPKILVISDNSFSTHEYLPLMTTNWLPLNGSFGKASGTQIGNYFYNAWNGLGTFSAEDGTDTFFARSHFMLANGGMVSNISSVVNGFTTSAIQVRGWKLSSFGTLQVLTNTVGGTTNLFRTIDCASGATLSAFVTNWTIPTITNLTVTVKSIGTNILMDIGQWNTNIYSGAVWDFWESQNFGFYPFTDTAAHSNYFRTFVLNSGYNAVIVDDIAGSNSLYSGISYFNDMLTNSGIDFIVTTPVAPTNDVPTWLDTRDAVLAAARDFNIAAIDVSPYFLNTALNGWQYFDEIHQIRTNALGNAARKRDAAISIGGQLVSAIGLNYEKFQPFGYTNLANPTPDISGKANLAGGNSFTGSQTFGGYLQSTGTLSSIILNYRNDNSRQFSAYATGSGVLFNDSAESGPWMTKSNIAGVTSLNFTPYGGASVVKFGDKSFLSYYGDGLNVTNLQATNIVGTAGSDFATNAYNLTYSGETNVLVDLSLAKHFKLTVTNNSWLIFTNVAQLNNAGASVQFKMNATGGYSVLLYTNNTVEPSGNRITVYTNANALSGWWLARDFFTETNVLISRVNNFTY